jgi:hypothetical protein
MKPDKKWLQARHWWLTPIILATQEAEIKRLLIRSQPGKIVCETLSQQYPTLKRDGRLAQVVEPLLSRQFSVQTHSTTKTKKERKKDRKKEMILDQEFIKQFFIAGNPWAHKPLLTLCCFNSSLSMPMFYLESTFNKYLLNE